MAWRQKITDFVADVLRVVSLACLWISIIILSLATVYLAARVTWFFLRYLERTIFANPW